MPLPASLANSLELPVVGSPLFIVSGPELVIAQCKAGIVGSFPRDEGLAQVPVHRRLSPLCSFLTDHLFNIERPGRAVQSYNGR